MARGSRTQVGFIVSGMPEVKAALDQLSRRMGRAALERAGMDAAEPLARRMRQIANQPEQRDTGELAESIDVGTTATDYDYGAKAYSKAKAAGLSDEQALLHKRDVLRDIKGQRGDTYASVYVGPVSGRTRDEVIKGYVNEFGSFQMAPQPFMRPAWEQDRAALLERLKENIRFEVFAAVEKAQRLGRLK